MALALSQGGAMRRREFVFGMNAALMVGACLPSQAQKGAKSKIGYLNAGSKNSPISQRYLKASWRLQRLPSQPADNPTPLLAQAARRPINSPLEARP
jgi:hypothetical protein